MAGRDNPGDRFARKWAPHLVPPVRGPWWQRVNWFRTAVWTGALAFTLAFWIPVIILMWRAVGAALHWSN